MRENLRSCLERKRLNPANHGFNLADVSFTLQTGRKSFNYRGMTVCSTIDEAVEHLSETESGQFKTFSSPEKNRPVVFMFPGQGSQYVNMGLELYQKESRFRKEMDHCFDILKPLVDYDLKEILYPDEATKTPRHQDRGVSIGSPRRGVNQTEITQPVIFVFEYALAKLLMAWGITPSAMIGHSIGEYTAACLAKVLSLEDALNLVALRGKLMQQMPTGAMLSVPLPEQEVTSLLMLNEKLELSLAAVNGSSRCVVSGTQEAVDTFAKQLKKRGYENRSIHTSHAFHSKMMDPILEEFQEKVKQISFNKPQIPYLSNLSGQWITDEAVAEPGYWVNHLRHTVRFFNGLSELLKKEEKAVLAEVGPGRVLSTFTRQHPDKTPNQLTLNLVRHPKESTSDVQYLLSKIGNLWLYGKEIDWDAFYSGETRHRVSLPSYPFERHPYRISGEAFSIVGAKTPLEEIQLNKKADITDWFYTPSWKRVRLPLYEKKQMPGQTIWLLFTHEHALCKRLEEQLKKEDQEVIVVKQGETFAKKDEREFTLNPRQEGDYDVLFKTLHSMERFPQRILHLWVLASPSTSVENQPLDINGVEQELGTGFYSLLNIAKVVGTFNVRAQLKIDVVTDNMQEVTGDEQLCPAKAAVLGPVKIIPLEYPSIQCRSIDIVFSHKQRLQEEEILTPLLAELSQDAPSPSAVVALRRRHRWIQDFEPIRLEKHSDSIPRLRQGGIYLITGGLGGMGLVLARFIADRVKAKLVLTSRSDFPAPEAWDQWLDKHPGNDKISEKIRKIQELEKSGADVWVAKGDVANREEMKYLMEKIKERFGPLNGVIHSAGVPDGRLIHLRTREFTESILAPKVRGTLVLDSLVQSHHHYPLDFFVLCSSLNSIIGEIGQVGYTAANCFLDAYASHKTISGGSFTVSINWDAWQETGMAKEARENRVIRDPNQESIMSRLRPKSQWVIGEHRVNGTATLVGTAYLEMVNTAFERHAKGQNVEIRDFYYLAPLTVEEDEEKEVCIILEKEEAQWKFSLISRLNSDENQWQVHARGKLAAVESEPTRTISIENIREKCRVHQQDQKETSVHTFKPGAQSQLIAVGRRWDNLKKVWYGENQGLALLELASEFLEDIESHNLHPALLDSAAAFLIDSLHSQEAYLPFSYKRVKIMGSLPAKVFSYARFVEKDPSQKQVLEFNITIMDETGKELIDIEGLTVLAISKEKKKTPGQSEWVTPALVPAPTETVQKNSLKDAILTHEGVEVFERVLYDTLPQVVVSTVDFPLRLEKVKDRPTPGLAEPPDEESTVGPSHPRPELSTPYVAPKTGTQKALASIWQEYLGIQAIGIHDDFFELGADSLKALTVIARIHKKLNVEVSITEIFNSPTIAALAEYIEGAGKSIYTSITPVEEKEYYPLSSAQTRLYLLQQLQRESVFYNLPFVCIVEGPLDISRLEEALQVLIQRHESLRTSFELIDDEPVQKIHRTVDFKVKYHGSERKAHSAKQEEKPHAPCAVRHASTIKHFVRPFDLTCTPLMRMEVVKIGKEKYLWLFDIHHIITDATGYAVLQKDLVKLYDRKKLHALRIQYKDFSAWQNRLIRSEEIKEQEKYWLNVYSDSGEIPRLNMPTDFPRPEKLRFEGGRFYFKLGTEDTQKFKELGSHAGATLFATLLSVLNVLLFKYTGQNDIIVGGSIAGRPHADLQDIVGMFVNMLPIRIYPYQEMTYWELLQQVKTTSLNAFENQDMQFEMLVEQLKPTAETSRNPLFDFCLNVQNYEQPEIEIKGLTMTPCPYEPDTSKFDMLVWANPVGDDIHFMLEYSTELFKPSSIEEFSKHFIEIIQQVIKNKEISLKDIKISQKLLMPESDVPEIDFGF
jgi:acyl transferase domain-containing protein